MTVPSMNTLMPHRLKFSFLDKIKAQLYLVHTIYYHNLAKCMLIKIITDSLVSHLNIPMSSKE